ncbi:MAG: hypothetical protein ACI9FN_000605 [Saprospiraceae bacterium]|jgi:hypothetical protein
MTFHGLEANLKKGNKIHIYGNSAVRIKMNKSIIIMRSCERQQPSFQWVITLWN